MTTYPDTDPDLTHDPQVPPMANPNPAVGSPTPTDQARRSFWATMSRRLINDTAYLLAAYLLAAFPLAIASFVVILFLLSTGISLALFWVGLPILALTAVAARGFAYVERVMMHRFLAMEAPTPQYARRAEPATWFARMPAPWTDPQSWPVWCSTWSGSSCRRSPSSSPSPGG